MLQRLGKLLKDRVPGNRSLNKFERVSKLDEVEAMRARAKKYEENTGVALKEGVVDDDDEIDWNAPFSAADTQEAARRCFAKHRNTDPADLTPTKVRLLLAEVKGYRPDPSLSATACQEVITWWKLLHAKEIEKVTFDNVASYEP